MSQAQPKSTPPPLPGIGQRTEAQPIASGHVEHEFFRELREGHDVSLEATEELLPSPPDPAAHVPEARAVYHFTGGQAPGSNVYHLPSARLDGARPHGAQPANVWHHHEPSYHAGMEPGRGRVRNPRRTRQATVQNQYRAGYFIAALFALMGWLMVGAGAAASAISILQPDVPTRLGSPDLLASAGGVLVIGFLTVALGLAARALFDIANSSRQILAIHRERWGQEP
jgi:hypothetical protein